MGDWRVPALPNKRIEPTPRARMLTPEAGLAEGRPTVNRRAEPTKPHDDLLQNDPHMWVPARFSGLRPLSAAVDRRAGLAEGRPTVHRRAGLAAEQEFDIK